MKTVDIDKKLDAADYFYNQKNDYYRAGLLYEDLIPVTVGSSKAEDIQYRYAYSQYKQKLYPLSAHYFKSFYDTYRGSKKAEEALYMHAYSLYESAPKYYLDQSNTTDAITAMQTFINVYPNSELKKEAEQVITILRERLEKKNLEIALLYSKLSRHKAAVVALKNFERDFPDSDELEQVRFKKVEASLSLAQKSIIALKKERLEESIQHYYKFAEKYPESEYLDRAIKLFETAQKGLQELKEKNNNS